MSWSSSTTAAYAQGSAPTLPAAGGTFSDPVFGTEIVRITDANTASSAPFGVAYSYWPTFNANNTKLLALNLITGDGRIIDFNPSTLAVGSGIAGPAGVGSYEWAVYWSRTDPNIMYGTSGLAVRQLDVSAGSPAWSTIATYTAGELGITGASYFHQIHVSDDGQWLSATVKNGSSTSIGYAVVKLNATKVVKYAATSSDIDEVQIDKSGRYLVHKTGNQGSGIVEVKIIDMEATPSPTVTDLIDDSPDQAPGHSDNGNGIICGHANYLDAYTCRSLGSPHSYTTLLQDGTYSWLQSQHFSMRHSNEQWVLVSQFGSVATQKFNNEIYFLKTDGSGEVRRFVKHYSGTDYGYISKANSSIDGKFVAFTSSMNASSSGRRDLFIAVVPSDMGIWSQGPTNSTSILANGTPLVMGGQIITGSPAGD